MFFARMFNPLIALLRPVSPLGVVTDWPAVVPEGGTGFQLDHFYLLYIWPMVINTAEGVRRIPQDLLFNVARVLQLSEWTVMRKILFSGSAARGINRRAAVDRHCPGCDRRRRDADRRVGIDSGSGTDGTTSMWKTSSSPSSLSASSACCSNRGSYCSPAASAQEK